MPIFQSQVYAPMIVPPPEQLFNESVIIVVGHVTSATDIQNGTRTEYTIQPQEYLKPNSTDTTQPIIAYGAGSKNFNPYSRIYHVGDRALFFLEEKNVSLVIMPYSIWTRSDCNGEQLLVLNNSPGDFTITQGNNTRDDMVTGRPINITGYVHNTPDLKPLDAEMSFTIHTPNQNITLAKNRQVHIDQCRGFAQSSFVFVPTMSGRYGISVDSYDANGKQVGGGSFCCITVSNRNGTPSQPAVNTSDVSNPTFYSENRTGMAVLRLHDRVNINFTASTGDAGFDGRVFYTIIEGNNATTKSENFTGKESPKTFSFPYTPDKTGSFGISNGIMTNSGSFRTARDQGFVVVENFSKAMKFNGQCRTPFPHNMLAIKPDFSTGACVKIDTLHVLRQRGWH
ncbi:MAG: hypothetical protein KGI27_06180 [Thaumarchaeota archaeon]|nr:hypothetical protein [Nitrososphaerota archaeon]